MDDTQSQTLEERSSELNFKWKEKDLTDCTKEELIECTQFCVKNLIVFRAENGLLKGKITTLEEKCEEYKNTQKEKIVYRTEYGAGVCGLCGSASCRGTCFK